MTRPAGTRLAASKTGWAMSRPPRLLPDGSVLVVVILVGGMLVAVVKVVDVVAVLNGLVAAALAVGVVGHGVLGNRLVLVVVVAMEGVAVGAVHVVDVVAVLNGLVAAALSVGVLLDAVLGMNVGHLAVLSVDVSAAGAGSSEWAKASAIT